MNEQAITFEILNQEKVLSSAQVVIVVPADAPEYPEKITSFTTESPANAKHAYHALSQIALVDFEDNILDFHHVPKGTSLIVRNKTVVKTIDRGLVITRDSQGKVHMFCHEDMDKYSLLKFAHRFCTRWIRLDI